MTEQVLTDIVTASGLWQGTRKASHGFLLSPDVFRLNSKDASALEALAVALHTCMGGLGRIAALASMPRIATGTTWGMIARLTNIGVPKYYQDIQHLFPGRVPVVCKVDLLEAQDGQFLIAEIDGHNKHGLGYSELAAQCRRAVNQEGDTFPGVVTALERELSRRGTDRLTVLYADQERFYLPELEVLQAAFAERGVTLTIVGENDLQVVGGALLMQGQRFSPRLLLDLPFLFHNSDLRDWLVEQTRNGCIDFLISPKPFLGSKAMLALLRNERQDPELEAILRAFIAGDCLDRVRQAIPVTHLVGGRGSLPLLTSTSPQFVLKESISSGMKGTLFMENERFSEEFRAALSSPYRFILQAEVANRARRYQAYMNGKLVSADWFQRITMHIIGRRIADIVVTARQDKSVHGAPDCLQLGTIIVSE